MAGFRDLVNGHFSDLGGVEYASEAEKSILRRATTIEVELERLETSFAESGLEGPNSKDLDLYYRGSAHLRRLLEAVGLQRRARDVPTLQEFISQRGGGEA